MIHSTLGRQLHKVGVEASVPPSLEQWHQLLARVSEAYVQGDNERYTLERSIDISSREMIELNMRLATERDRMQITLASIGDGLCVLGADGLVETANPAAERLLGSQPGGLGRKDFVAMVSGAPGAQAERDGALEQLARAVRSGGSCRSADARFMTGEGRWIAVSFSLTPIDESHSGGSVLLFADISMRKASEAALRESESRFRAIFELAAVGIVRLGLDGRIADCNLAFCAMLGSQSEDTLGKNVFSRMHPDDVLAARDRFEALKVSGRGGDQVECRYVRTDGSTVWAQQALSFVRNASGAPVFAVGVIENVTSRKDLEVSLRQAQKLEAVGQLAAGIAHEINTPVQFVSDSVHFVRDAVTDMFGVLKCYGALAEAAAATLPELCAAVTAAEEAADVEYLAEQLPKALERALDGLQRVATLVRGMKAFAHPDRKEMAPADLNHALETTLAIARNEYKYVATIEKDFGPLSPVKCHIGQLNQVFLNVIVNAAHAIVCDKRWFVAPIRRAPSASRRGKKTAPSSSPSATPGRASRRGSGIASSIRFSRRKRSGGARAKVSPSVGRSSSTRTRAVSRSRPKSVAVRRTRSACLRSSPTRPPPRRLHEARPLRRRRAGRPRRPP